jgi:dienelactone hydrolase
MRTEADVLDLLATRRFAEIRDLFAPSLRPMVSADAIEVTWAATLETNGPVTEIGPPVREPAGSGTVQVKIPVRFERGAVTVVMTVLDDEGWLTGLQLAPAGAAEPVRPWEPPDYADPERFTEQDVTVGNGPLAVDGTLSLPRSGTGTAVVLLTGSGPNDRDETIGRNKPFKDIAWGLASRGITVLRYDKVTYAHPDQVRARRDFTLADEYVPHAVAAVDLLRRDHDRVFVLGHSQGGTAAPRVAVAAPSIAGLVIMAGGTLPLHWAAVNQFRYLASLNPATAAVSQHTVDAITRQARTVDSADLSPSTPDSELPFGAPAPYWLDLRTYDPAATAAGLGKPILILQGGRDYQVTVAEDLAGWRTALADRPDVTIRVYEADNHLFCTGTGPSTPAEYEPAQHMDPTVVTDIADWLSA